MVVLKENIMFFYTGKYLEMLLSISIAVGCGLLMRIIV